MSIYLIVVAVVIIFGVLMPQEGKYKGAYIALMAAVHAFVCAFRYMYLTGDLRKYAAEYYILPYRDWFDEEVFHGGRNFLFYWLEKSFAGLGDGSFQPLLIFIAVVIEVIVAIVIYKYSTRPWLSYIVWNCMGFYLQGFSSIKQSLAMAFVLVAMTAILDNRPIRFLVFIAIAGAIHMPALVLLPAYWVCKMKMGYRTIFAYIGAAIVIYAMRNRIVLYASEFYYEETDFNMGMTGVGGRFFLILLILIAGLVLKGFKDKEFEMLFHLVTIALIIQMFAGFDNVFTRLSDYYLQVLVLYVPMLFYKSYERPERRNVYGFNPILPFTESSLKALAVLVMFAFVWFYNTTTIDVEIASEQDDYTNFRFMWQVDFDEQAMKQGIVMNSKDELYE